MIYGDAAEALRERLNALRDAAGAAHAASDFASLRRVADELAAFGQLNRAPEFVAWGEYYRGIGFIHAFDGHRAETSLRIALAFFESCGDRLAAARTMMNLASIAIDIDVDPARGRRLYEAASQAIDERGDARTRGILRGNLGEVCRLEGDYDGALRNGTLAWELLAGAGERGLAAWQLVNIAHYHTLRRDHSAAVETMRRAFRELQGDRNPLHVAWYFDVWVIVASKLNRWEAAARLLAFVGRYRSEHGLVRLPGMLPWLSDPMERLDSMLSADVVTRLLDEGNALSLSDAQSLALSIAT